MKVGCHSSGVVIKFGVSSRMQVKQKAVGSKACDLYLSERVKQVFDESGLYCLRFEVNPFLYSL